MPTGGNAKRQRRSHGWGRAISAASATVAAHTAAASATCTSTTPHGERVAPLDLADRHLDDEQREREHADPPQAGPRSPAPPQRQEKRGEAEAEHGSHAHVELDRVDEVAEPPDVGAARVRAGRGGEGARDDERAGGGDDEKRGRPQPPGETIGGERAALVTPCLERDDDPARQDGQGEDEVGEDENRMEVGEDRTSPAGPGAIVPTNVASGDRPTHRSTPGRAAAATQAASESVIGKSATTRLPNSTNAWSSLAGKNARPGSPASSRSRAPTRSGGRRRR